MNWKDIIKTNGGQLNKKHYTMQNPDWMDAFSKFGFGDNLESSDKTDIVVAFIESQTPNTSVRNYHEEVKYVVEIMQTSIHNDYIHKIGYTNDEYKSERGRNFVYDYKYPESAEEQIERQDPYLFDALEDKFRWGV
jgi:hypothetical protein